MTRPISTPRSRLQIPMLLLALTAGTSIVLSERRAHAAPLALTADEVARRAQETSRELQAHGADRAAAEAAVSQATAGFVPRLSGTARYTRLSPLTPPSLGNIVVAPPGTPPGTTPDPSRLIAVPFTFPVIEDNYVAQATLQIPLSDYLLRLPDARAAAQAGARAAALGESATRLQVGTDARVAYYQWVRARLQAGVARDAVEQANQHLTDVRTAAAAGTASPADVLRVEAQLASAQLLVTRAENLATLGEQQLRTLMHDESGAPYEAAEGIDAPAPTASNEPADESIDALWAQATERRPELRALEEGATAARRQASVARAAGLPRLDAVGNATYANPNQRIIPQEAKYRGTWDASIQLTWAPTDLFGSEAAHRAATARAAESEAHRAAALDGVRLEVTQSAQRVREARAAIATTARGLAAAEESARVRRVLFQNGRATSVELTDAETELTRARLEVVTARIDLHIARARLQHALGKVGDG